MPAAPSPPSLKLPEPVKDLSVVRSGNEVRLRWTMPQSSTDRLPLAGPQAAHICRKLPGGACESIADREFLPAQAAEYTDRLSGELSSGEPRLLTYLVELRNHAGHTAGSSNPASVVAGAAPAPLAGLAAEVRKEGVLLRWQPAPGWRPEWQIRLHRTLESSAPPQAASAQSPLLKLPPEPAEQSLLVPAAAGRDPAQALDASARFNRKYRYTAEYFLRLTLNGGQVELAGEPGGPVSVETKDVFPPNPPTGLAAVAVPSQGAIDLSWTPNTEADLAGYFVYRRETQEAPIRISSKEIAPAFRDATAQPGHRYRYSVAAVDESGNESARSSEVEENLPQ